MTYWEYTTCYPCKSKYVQNSGCKYLHTEKKRKRAAQCTRRYHVVVLNPDALSAVRAELRASRRREPTSDVSEMRAEAPSR